MQKWYQIFQKNTGLSPYVWVVFYILPFYYFSSSSTSHIILGTAIILVFSACYVLAFVSQGWLIYFWTSVQIVISITMTLLFSYMYFSIFIAYLIGNIKSKAAFMTLYIVLMIVTIGLINYGFVSENPVFIKQIPFILLNLIGVILLPITNFNRNKSDRLQVQLEDANKKISELIKLEERQRIARDLHDTLGQKLSLIGLKSDLAGKLIDQYPERARVEINDVRLTARSALKEVREMVTQMRGMRLEDELLRIRQILKAAHIELTLEGDAKLKHTSLMNENVLSMCMKEAVTNVVKHSGATACSIIIEPSRKELTLRIQDNGIGVMGEHAIFRGHGLQGIKERLEFVNGCMELHSDQGTTLVIKVPNITEKPDEEVER